MVPKVENVEFALPSPVYPQSWSGKKKAKQAIYQQYTKVLNDKRNCELVTFLSLDNGVFQITHTNKINSFFSNSNTDISQSLYRNWKRKEVHGIYNLVCILQARPKGHLLFLDFWYLLNGEESPCTLSKLIEPFCLHNFVNYAS